MAKAQLHDEEPLDIPDAEVGFFESLGYRVTGAEAPVTPAEPEDAEATSKDADDTPVADATEPVEPAEPDEPAKLTAADIVSGPEPEPKVRRKPGPKPKADDLL